MNRRKFIENAGLLFVAALFTPIILNATGKENPTILIVSGWQDVNIGDIAHTPGLIALLKKRLPKARLILWKRSKSQLVEDLMHKHYPELRIINGKYETDNEVKQAYQEADFFIHGSGPSVIAADFLASWHKETRKPFGIFGVTIGEVSASLKNTLQQAAFIFTRETASIEVLKKAGLAGSHIAFAPDATFVLAIHDEQKAKQFMQANKLQQRKFICVIPRLRRTPYYKIKPNNNGWSEKTIREVNELNDKYKEIDHAKLREAMIAWVRKTKNKVVVCPEMTYQVDIMDELLINPLPADVKPFIVKHGYWLPDEAASLYAQATAVLSFECHSPIIAAANGTPSFYLRQPEDTIKGQMYYDLGLKDWTFEINETTGQQITERLMQVQGNYKAALNNVKSAVAKVDKQYDLALQVLTEKFNIV
ncbi:polysaccharide pyruvyl transferase family protein [Adhaeribacter rhizoryzae]|uniref:Polysaccharide pyruvyl transferase family protein n=1 Tax=Adhaeribacter rhizoryzae TaxID=2607907 RepID=A0A5M6DMX7_9BACT|nr:polysaccharide pyruvyl transferase family protein [Adhaeribacter rhizoryzae]KAA5546765.1 polysaccharide pyruvyl transferase family protein [Adhaeribacter rhizoryzae]